MISTQVLRVDHGSLGSHGAGAADASFILYMVMVMIMVIVIVTLEKTKKTKEKKKFQVPKIVCLYCIFVSNQRHSVYVVIQSVSQSLTIL